MYPLYQKLEKIPGGKALYSRMIWRMVPYTGSVYPEVLELRPGFARLRVKDRRSVRNHLQSVHAAALMNMAEAASGLAFLAGFPPRTRGILKGFQIEYLKKARGTLTAQAQTPVLTSNTTSDYQVTAEVHNAKGELVAKAIAHWLIGPEED